MRRRWTLVGLTTSLILLLGTSMAWYLYLGAPAKAPARTANYIVDPTQAPRPALPRFNFVHPRLPAPTVAEIGQLRKHNPGFLREHRRKGSNGRGDFWSAIFSAYVEPSSQDLDALHARLMALEFEGRGHEQAQPLAMAYDWLYDHWSDTQRVQLRKKLLEGAHYLIKLIQDGQLSPYNVILYNRPFPALMAITLALYRDTPDAEPVMAFTHHLWKNRMLPVWRQVMGQHGGWHEGGEYVGIGIGRSVYQLPAMWRKATGEDLFAQEPGLRGFLDFLIYRTRPDGSHFRWGDAAYFDRQVPDRIPLALEFRHAAAYSLGGCPKPHRPSSWPWGPLTDSALCDPAAIDRMPTHYLADGLGLMVARSGWDKGATYVTFKAGDNFWSHSHLDQGAFTLYKGGALAIDSGLYGPNYGSDHHMNYTYQSIAHNLITVTDPEDRLPMPPRKDSPERPIANDGGQRRIGSGWGRPAPMSLEDWEAQREIYHTASMRMVTDQQELSIEDWEAQREIYHTASMRTVTDQQELSIAWADLTPAYTNRYSGQGTFAHRTRRVEQYRRLFAYDRRDDVVVIFDQLALTDLTLVPSWLLHTLEKPETSEGTVQVAVPPTDGSNHQAQRPGGKLMVKVLFPEAHSLKLLGGPGFEFFVGDRNYDEGGKVQATAAKGRNREIGSWRVELMPGRQATQHRFLTVLVPSPFGEHPTHQVRRLNEGHHIGAEIVGPNRTLRWWLEAGGERLRVEQLVDGRFVPVVEIP